MVMEDGHGGWTFGPTGLIPSKQLEEKRQAFVQPDNDYSKSSLCKYCIKNIFILQ